MSGDISGRRIIITGASSGVGQAAAETFVRQGARVAMLARRADVLEGQARQWGERAIPVTVDVSDPDSCRVALDTALCRLGSVDAVVNAAGVASPISLPALGPDEWNAVIATNLSGTFYVARHAGLHMRANGGGAVVNIASELGVIGMAEYAAYCASKSGVIGLTRALAAELAPDVRVNVLCPGPIDTPQLHAEFDCYADPEQVRADTIERVPLKRLATAHEVVDAIRFLAFEAPFATGTVMALDGGTTMV